MEISRGESSHPPERADVVLKAVNTSVTEDEKNQENARKESSSMRLSNAANEKGTASHGEKRDGINKKHKERNLYGDRKSESQSKGRDACLHGNAQHVSLGFGKRMIEGRHYGGNQERGERSRERKS